MNHVQLPTLNHMLLVENLPITSASNTYIVNLPAARMGLCDPALDHDVEDRVVSLFDLLLVAAVPLLSTVNSDGCLY